MQEIINTKLIYRISVWYYFGKKKGKPVAYWKKNKLTQ